MSNPTHKKPSRYVDMSLHASSNTLVDHAERSSSPISDSSTVSDSMSLLPRDQKDLQEPRFWKQLEQKGLSETALICKLALPISLTGLMELLLSFVNVFALGNVTI
jgi:hypothetical protein